MNIAWSVCQYYFSFCIYCILKPQLIGLLMKWELSHVSVKVAVEQERLLVLFCLGARNFTWGLGISPAPLRYMPITTELYPQLHWAVSPAPLRYIPALQFLSKWSGVCFLSYTSGRRKVSSLPSPPDLGIKPRSFHFQARTLLQNFTPIHQPVVFCSMHNCM